MIVWILLFVKVEKMGIGDTAFVVQLRNDSYLTISLIVGIVVRG